MRSISFSKTCLKIDQFHYNMIEFLPKARSYIYIPSWLIIYKLYCYVFADLPAGWWHFTIVLPVAGRGVGKEGGGGGVRHPRRRDYSRPFTWKRLLFNLMHPSHRNGKFMLNQLTSEIFFLKRYSYGLTANRSDITTQSFLKITHLVILGWSLLSPTGGIFMNIALTFNSKTNIYNL